MSQSLALAEPISPSMLLDTSRQMARSILFPVLAGSAAAGASPAPTAQTARAMTIAPKPRRVLLLTLLMHAIMIYLPSLGLRPDTFSKQLNKAVDRRGQLAASDP